MNVQGILTSLEIAWEQLPIPALFFYVIILGMLWLALEYWVSRTGRATPGWKRPVPVLPAVSEAVVWLVRGSSWALWTWAILYFVLALTIFTSRLAPLPEFTDVVYSASGLWHDAYARVVDLVPAALATRLPGV
ncbi:MAG: hypothetical protein KDD83_04770 [Caldilineaceae bacterium]|nr:hypothetical protein [Caldilineaceae bacterium]MCB0157420.1 hypothetical protein [Caldilineaceae bacterium]